MNQSITIQENVQGGKIVAVKPLLLESEPIEVIKVNELLEPVYSSCSGKLNWVKVGDIRESTKSGKYRVIEDLGTREYGNKKHRFFKIQFLETGFISEFGYRELKSSLIKDIYQRSAYGIGYLGEIDFNIPYYKELHNTWRNILNRCYNPNTHNYKNYGGKGIFVDNRWYSFSNFYWDVQELNGWDRKLDNWKDYSLDKDILCASNCYSKETCVWASNNEQKLNRSDTHYFSAINPNGNREYFVGTYFMSERHSLSRPNVSLCLLSKCKTHKGWSNFKPIEPPQGYVLRWWSNNRL